MKPKYLSKEEVEYFTRPFVLGFIGIVIVYNIIRGWFEK